MSVADNLLIGIIFTAVSLIRSFTLRRVGATHWAGSSTSGAPPRIFAAWTIQKRKRNPMVGSMLLRWRKPKANPLFTCENMNPK